MVLHADYSQGSSYTRDDKTYTVVSNTFESNYITVRDENGNIIRQKKDAPILRFQEQQEQRRSDEVAYYKDQAKTAGKEKNNWREKVKEFWTQLNNLDKNDELYGATKDEYWNARFTYTAFSNREHSALTNAFIAAT